MTREYENGDVVLVKGVYKEMKCANGESIAYFISDLPIRDTRCIVGLASEFEQKDKEEWCDTIDALPDNAEYVWATIAYPNSGPTTSMAVYAGKEWFYDEDCMRKIGNPVIKWMPIVYPKPYIPSLEYCKTCMHMRVCRFSVAASIIGVATGCNGEHYKQQDV